MSGIDLLAFQRRFSCTLLISPLVDILKLQSTAL